MSSRGLLRPVVQSGGGGGAPDVHGNEAHDPDFIDGSDPRLTNARTPTAHGDDKHTANYIEEGDARLTDARTPTVHGDAYHSSTYIKEGDPRLTDSRDPNAHGDAAHTETYIKEGDPRLADARTPTEHGNEAHDPDFLESGGDVELDDLDITGKAWYRSDGQRSGYPLALSTRKEVQHFRKDIYSGFLDTPQAGPHNSIWDVEWSGRYLLASTYSGIIYSYVRDPYTGAITLVSQIDIGSNTYSIAYDGKFVFAVRWDSAVYLCSLSLSDAGVLALVDEDSSMGFSTSIDNVRVYPYRDLVLVFSGNGSNGFAVYRRDSEGNLGFSSIQSPGTPAFNGCVSNGYFCVASNSGVRSFSESGGVFTLKDSQADGVGCLAIVTHQGYVVAAYNSVLYSYTIGIDGLISAVVGSVSIPGATTIRDLESDGQFVYVAGQAQIHVVYVASDGSMTLVYEDGQPSSNYYSVCAKDDAFVYAAAYAGKVLSYRKLKVYGHSPPTNTHVFTGDMDLSGTPFFRSAVQESGYPLALATNRSVQLIQKPVFSGILETPQAGAEVYIRDVVWTGKFAVTSGYDGKIYSYTRHPATGALTKISELDIGGFSYSIEYDGKYIYSFTDTTTIFLCSISISDAGVLALVDSDDSSAYTLPDNVCIVLYKNFIILFSGNNTDGLVTYKRNYAGKLQYIGKQLSSAAAINGCAHDRYFIVARGNTGFSSCSEENGQFTIVNTKSDGAVLRTISHKGFVITIGGTVRSYSLAADGTISNYISQLTIGALDIDTDGEYLYLACSSVGCVVYCDFDGNLSQIGNDYDEANSTYNGVCAKDPDFIYFAAYGAKLLCHKKQKALEFNPVAQVIRAYKPIVSSFMKIEDCFDSWSAGPAGVYGDAYDIATGAIGSGTNDISTNPSYATQTTQAAADTQEMTRSVYPIVLRSRTPRFEVAVELSQIDADTEYRAGFCAEADGGAGIVATEKFIWIDFRKNTSDNWQLLVDDGTDTETIDSGVAATTDETILAIWVDSDGSVHWSIDGIKMTESGLTNKMAADGHYFAFLTRSSAGGGGGAKVSKTDYLIFHKAK